MRKSNKLNQLKKARQHESAVAGRTKAVPLGDPEPNTHGEIHTTNSIQIQRSGTRNRRTVFRGDHLQCTPTAYGRRHPTYVKQAIKSQSSNHVRDRPGTGQFFVDSLF